MRQIIAAIVLAMVATTASGWFGGDSDHWDGWGNGSGYGAHDGWGRGHGYGRTDMDGNFSMTITANGRAHTDMDTDFDGDWNSDWDYHGDQHWGSYTDYPVYGRYYAPVAVRNPTAGYEAHRKLVEERRAAAEQRRSEKRVEQ